MPKIFWLCSVCERGKKAIFNKDWEKSWKNCGLVWRPIW